MASSVPTDQGSLVIQPNVAPTSSPANTPTSTGSGVDANLANLDPAATDVTMNAGTFAAPAGDGDEAGQGAYTSTQGQA
jgi:hypothetical protein